MVAHKSKSAFRTIAEAAEELGVATHVLRFWEKKFPQIQPMKMNGGRRYYRPDDMELLRVIKDYLYNKRYTIEGVQKILKSNKMKDLLGESIQSDFFEQDNVAELAASEPDTQTLPVNNCRISEDYKNELKSLIMDLEQIKKQLVQATEESV